MKHKNCIKCGIVFFKKVNCSQKNWDNRSVFCSRLCAGNFKKGKPLLWLREFQFKKGVQNNPNGGFEKEHTPWNKGNGEYAKKLGFGKWMLGKKHTLETIKKQSEIVKKRIQDGKHNFYIDGRTPLNQQIRRSYKYRIWREAVFERDNYTCQECGAKCGNGKRVILNADHIKPFAYFPKLRFDINNGRTLCIECHKKTDTYMGRSHKYNSNFIRYRGICPNTIKN